MKRLNWLWLLRGVEWLCVLHALHHLQLFPLIMRSASAPHEWFTLLNPYTYKGLVAPTAIVLALEAGLYIKRRLTRPALSRPIGKLPEASA